MPKPKIASKQDSADKPKKKTKKTTEILVNKTKKKKKRPAKNKEKQAEKSKHCMNAFGQKKEAEKLAQGMICRNAELQLLGCEVKEEELVTNKDAVEEAERAFWAAQIAFDNDQCASGSSPFEFRILNFNFEH